MSAEAARPVRAPVGSARDVRARLPAARPATPLAVALYAALLGEDGLFGRPVRRRASGLAARSLPVAAAVGLSGLLALRVFADAPLGLPLAGAASALALALLHVLQRALATARRGGRATWREGLELGSLALVAAFAAAQLAEAHGPRGVTLRPLVDLVLAALVAWLPRAVGGGLLGLAAVLEASLWWGGGARAEELAAVGVRFGFTGLFAALSHLLLGGRLRAARRAEEAAVERRMRELDERARQLRLLAAAAEPGEGSRGEHAARLAEAAVLETDDAAGALLELAQVALRAHAAAAWLLTEDDRELRLWAARTAGGRLSRRAAAGEGALGVVVKQRAAIRLQGELRPTPPYEDGTAPRALLGVPLLSRVGGHLRGVVLVDRLDADPFGDADERFLARVAAELARAAAAERLIRDGRARRDEQERFYQAMERLNRTSTAREVFDAVIEAAAGMAPVDFGAVTLLEEDGAKPRHVVARALLSAEGARSAAPNRPASELEGRAFPDNGGLVACAVRLGSALPGRALRPADAVVFDEATRLRGLSSLKVLPLRAGEQVLGTLVLGSRAPGAYGGDVVRQLEVVALQAGDALLRARLFDATQRLATTDGLTGLVNHRTFQGRLEEHLAAAQRYGKKVSLLLTDIDHFKSVNDTYGHPVGDQVLRGVAHLLASEARATDVAARYGGEEFALVMPETDLAGALHTAERLREKVGRAVFRTEKGELRVTISIGVATFPDDAAEKRDLVAHADGGLYHAKRSGRNQTVALSRIKPGRRPEATSSDRRAPVPPARAP